ncbi:MAG: hypothetical protein F4X56_09285 [Gammaproteobacteria bacterium]|nr:hypothetical protein [Gammaproteobacteria bacterium]
MALFSSFIVSCFALASHSLINFDTAKRDSLEVELKFALESEHSKPNISRRKRSKNNKVVELIKEFIAQANDNEII